MHIFYLFDSQILNGVSYLKIWKKIILFRPRKQKYKNRKVDLKLEEANPIIGKLKNIIGKELKYHQLCEALDLPKKGTRQKASQLKQLLIYCDYETLPKPTRYVVTQVYEKEVKVFLEINKNNKYQIMFDAVIYQALLENGGKPLYVSTIDMLKLFAEVNENFVYTCSSENMAKLGENFIYFTEMGQIAKKMLARWTKERIKSMVIRSLIKKETGYRLYSLHKGKYGEFRKGHNISVDSEAGKQCMAIMAQAIEEVVPKKYQIVKTSSEDEEEDKKMWLPLPIYNSLQHRVSELTKERFNNVYYDMKEISVLKPPSTEWIIDKLTKIYKNLPALHEINKEACRKILSSNSASFDKFTGAERKFFIEVNMSTKPSISLKQKLEELE